MNAPQKTPRLASDGVEIITLGCRLNACESTNMRALATQAALTNAVIVNTCAVTGEAVRQARQAIRRARRERPDAEIIVTGCAAQIDPQSFAAMPEVSRIIGNSEKMNADSFAGEHGRVEVSDIMEVRALAPHLQGGFSERTRAYVQVQNGCDHRCTFCIIPYGRGNARSAPAGEVIAQIERLLDDGAPEVVLTGVDLTSWGADLPGAPALGNLVARILKHAPRLRRLRLSSLDAIEMDPLLFEIVTQEPRIAPHLHLSLQHGDDLILKRMKRRHSRAQTIALCEALKTARPEIALGADLIAGFPTETAGQFANTLSLIEACQLAYVHTFPFSPRSGAPAARMPQLDRAVVKARAARLREAGAKALARHLETWVGREAEALVEREGFARLADFTGVLLGLPQRGRGQGVGGVRDKAQAAPSRCALPAPPPCPPPVGGRNAQSACVADQTVRLRFTGHDGAHLIGVPA